MFLKTRVYLPGALFFITETDTQLDYYYYYYYYYNRRTTVHIKCIQQRKIVQIQIQKMSQCALASEYARTFHIFTSVII